MKKLITLALAAVMLFSFAACSKSDVPSGMKVASSDVVDYTLYVPKEWLVDENTGMTGAHVSATDASSVSVMAWNLEETSTTPAEWWDNYRADFDLVFDSFEIIEESDALLGGVAARKYVYTAKLGENSYKFMQIACIRRSMVYLFTYTSVDSLYDDHTEEVASIIENFKFD